MGMQYNNNEYGSHSGGIKNERDTMHTATYPYADSLMKPRRFKNSKTPRKAQTTPKVGTSMGRSQWIAGMVPIK